MQNDFKTWKFPAGEIGLQLSTEKQLPNSFELKFNNSDSLIEMLLFVDAYRRLYLNRELHLKVDYFPYARQDRVMQKGESHSLKVIANLINSCYFDTVTTADPHSDVVEALVDRLVIIPQHVAAMQTVSDIKDNYDYLIAPDAGALKKIYKLGSLVELPVVCATKVRDTKTGKIEGVSISTEDYESLRNKRALVVDDIGDGMGTFVALADILKDNQPNIDKLDLYVTHGIFSKGLDILNGLYDRVYTYNLINNSMENHDLLG